MKEILVKPGDTLWDIAARETGNAQNLRRIYADNQKAIDKAQQVFGRRHLSGPDWIFPGAVLKVPA